MVGSNNGVCRNTSALLSTFMLGGIEGVKSKGQYLEFFHKSFYRTSSAPGRLDHDANSSSLAVA
jgi:hypothetical protein